MSAGATAELWRLHRPQQCLQRLRIGKPVVSPDLDGSDARNLRG